MKKQNLLAPAPRAISKPVPKWILPSGKKFLLPAVALVEAHGFIGSIGGGDTGADQRLDDYLFRAADALGLKRLFPGNKPIDYA